MNFEHNLMENNFSKEDIASLIDFLKKNNKNPILTQNKNVKKV